MTTYSVASGASPALTQTLAANAADTVTFADRAGYVSVTNSGTATMFVTTNGVAASTAGGNGAYTVAPGASATLANQLPVWFPSSKVIPAGVSLIPTGGGAAVATSTTQGTSPGNPGTTQPSMSSLAGHATNPGTTISLISMAAGTYTVALAG
jgi:hypothetical protein